MEEEKQYMLPLLAVPFEVAAWFIAKVPNDYLVFDGRNLSSSPCDFELDLMILREAKRESLEIIFAMREELHFYLKRTQIRETILAENGIPTPDYDD